MRVNNPIPFPGEGRGEGGFSEAWQSTFEIRNPGLWLQDEKKREIVDHHGLRPRDDHLASSICPETRYPRPESRCEATGLLRFAPNEQHQLTEGKIPLSPFFKGGRFKLPQKKAARLGGL